MKKSVVAIVRCASYDHGEVLAAVARGVNLCGGISRFISPGESIILKPNMLFVSSPEKCVITHTSVFRATALICKEGGATLSYGDSSAFIDAGRSHKKTGYEALSNELDVPRADFEIPVSVTHHQGIVGKRLVLSRCVTECDGLVSISKCKTHNLLLFTGAVKNQYGCVPGLAKGQYHAQYPDPYDFAGLLVDINTFIRPRLYIMDAVVAMEGNGPGGGEPRPLHAILVSPDPVALDAVACIMTTIPPGNVPTAPAGEQAGLGTWRSEEIEILGDSIEAFIDTSFKAVRRPPVHMKKGHFRRWLRNKLILRPEINSGHCIRCGACIISCPVEPKAVHWDKGNKNIPPVFSYDRCIRCLCCNETCPEKAIIVKRPAAGKFLPVLGFISLLLTRFEIKRDRRKNKGTAQ